MRVDIAGDVFEIEEAQRSEILFGLLERRKDLEKLVAEGVKGHAPNKTAEKLLRLYADGEEIDRVKGGRKLVPGLLAIFAAEPEISAEAAKKSPSAPSGQLDALESAPAAAPEAPVGFRDVNGQLHDTQGEAAAVNALQSQLNGDEGTGIGAEPVDESAPAAESSVEALHDEVLEEVQAEARSHLALVAGDDDAEVIGTIVDPLEAVPDATEPAGDHEAHLERQAPLEPQTDAEVRAVIAERDDLVRITGADVGGYDKSGRCVGCRSFRGEGHNARCVVANAYRLERQRVPAVEAPDPAEALRQAAANARPSGPPLPRHESTSM
jgi:hypothetical protein